ncbi:modification methylase [Candidatus Gracilibacteria bacterium]|nr:modification methylase [Candidatus Gracilibacteria bacterium]
MNYIGSKLSLLQFIENGINQIVGEKNYVFSDLFAGTGIVGRYFKQKGHKVIANDLQYYSFVLNRHYIGNHTDLYFANLTSEIPELLTGNVNKYKEIVCNYLNNLPGKKGFIYKNYSLGGTKGNEFERMYFSDENALKCDAIRSKIEEWKKEEKINENEYYFLLTSILEATDKVANTASVYGAFLKKLKASALKPLLLKPADLFLNDHEHTIYNEDINKLIKTTSHDVVYLDPPYNHRQYSGNYHLLETIAKYDNPKIKGVTGMRDCSSQKSLYCSRTEVKKIYKDLISNIDAKYIFLSYNDEGLMTLDDIKEIMSERGEYDVLKQEYKRFKADKTENRNHKQDKTIEYLHYVKIIN